MDASGRVKVEHGEHGCLQFISKRSSLGGRRALNWIHPTWSACAELHNVRKGT